MNLPSLAIDFLTLFRGLLCDSELRTEPCASLLPVVHCYIFSHADNPETDAAERTAAALGITSFEELEERSVRSVRNVAPGKEMLCVRLRLPWHVLTTGECGTSEFSYCCYICNYEQQVSGRLKFGCGFGAETGLNCSFGSVSVTVTTPNFTFGFSRNCTSDDRN